MLPVWAPFRGAAFTILVFAADDHFRDVIADGHFLLFGYYLLSLSLAAAAAGDMVRRNADWIKAFRDWKHRDDIRSFELPPYPAGDDLSLVVGEKHDERGRRITQPAWFTLKVPAVFTSVLVVGDTGSGKTTCVGYPWLESMLKAGLGGLVLDAGGSYVAFVRQLMHYLGRDGDLIVLEPGGPAKYNPLHKPDMTSADLAGWLHMVINNVQGASNQTATESFWDKAGRSYANVVIELCRLVDPDHLTLELLYRLNTDEGARKRILHQLKQELESGTTDERAHRIGHVLHYFQNEWEKMAASMRGSIPATFDAVVQIFSSDYPLSRTFCPHPHEGGIFPGFTNEAFDSGKVVVLNMPLRKYPDAGRTIATLLKLDFQTGVLRRTEGRSEAEVTRPVFLLIDEAQNYVTASKELGDTLYLAESRKNKAINIYMSQSIDSFKEAFHDQDSCNVFFNNLRTKVFLSQQGPESQKTCAELCGKATQWKKTITESEAGHGSSVNYAAGGLAHDEVAVSKTVAYAEQDDYLFKPHDFRNLPQFVSIVSAFDGGVKLRPVVVCMKPLFVNGQGQIAGRHSESWFTGAHANMLSYLDSIAEKSV